MRLEDCVRRDDKMEIRGTSCMLYVYKHRDTYPETMSTDAHSMMMRVFMGSITPRGFADFLMSLQISLTKKGPGVCDALGDSHSHVWVVCREVLHIHTSLRLEATRRE